MAQTDRKTRLEGLARQLHDARGGYEIIAVVELLNLRLESVRNSLVTCKPDEFLKLQGEAQAYDKVLRDILRPSPSRKTTEET